MIVEIETIQWCGDHVRMIDQTKLPHEETYVNCYTHQEVADAIRQMVIRGAPAIGVAAAMGVALGVKHITMPHDMTPNFKKIYDSLYESRPTAVNLKWALERMKQKFDVLRSANKSAGDIQRTLIDEAIQVYEEDIQINKQMANNGKKFIKDGVSVLTYCNTGTLATAGYGTALGVIRSAHEAGTKFKVYVSETRPFLQGLRLTSWELHKLKIPQMLISDNMAATLMAQKKIQAVFVGADRIAANGDTANKIGTYMMAVLAKAHRIPFYVVAPTSTIDIHIPNGTHIPIEERSPRELAQIQGHQIGLSDVPAYHPAFDVTPAELVTALITENGVIEPPSADSLCTLFNHNL